MPKVTKEGMLFGPKEIDDYRRKVVGLEVPIIESVVGGAILAFASLTKEVPIASFLLSTVALAMIFDGGRRYGRSDILITLFGAKEDDK